MESQTLVAVVFLVLPLVLFLAALALRGRLRQPEGAVEQQEPSVAPSPVPEVSEVKPAPVDDIDWSNLGIRPALPAVKTLAEWLPKGRAATVAGLVIEGGLIYVGGRLPRLSGGWGDENGPIDPALPVRHPPEIDIVSRLPYYPAYQSLNPVQRGAYLSWLAGDRADPAADIGLVFLYFYGLERRLIGERSEEDRADIIAEVERLRGVYGETSPFSRYSGELLAAARVMAGAVPDQPLTPERCSQSLLDFRIGLGRVVATTGALSGVWLYAWLLCDPQLPWRAAAKHAAQELRILFLRRFAEDYPEGMKIEDCERLFSPRYRAASNSFEVPLLADSERIPDITALTAPLEMGRGIAIGCMDQLDAFSRFVGKYPDKRGSLDAYLLLPEELRDRETEAVKAVRDWLAGVVAEPAALVPLTEVFRRVQGFVPEKLTRPGFLSLTGKLAAFGIGLEPDPAFGARLPRLDDEVALFRLGDTPALAPSEAWQGAVLTVALAVTIAHADGEVALQERALLHAHVDDAEGLSAGERLRLAAHLHWLLAHPPDLGGLRARAGGLPLESRRQIGRLGIAVAAADGVIHPSEVKLLSRLYRALGLDPETIYGELHALSTAGAEVPPLVPVATAPEASAPIQLDLDRIRRIRADTARVSAVLSTVFAEEAAPEPEPIAALVPEPESETAELFPGLDPGHRALLRELTVAERWPRDDYERLARSLDLMPGGAIEVINEWSFERFDEAVLEDDDPILVNLPLLSSPQPGLSPHV